ncbi:LysR family transcriptional regulator [Pseudonocardia acaciae]|uniref:LysR family transcriptional regulator n=1 Tax=Pseudonocardia acaciae TaxID=551276 RepID=UPI000683E2ED|nr:LysR family transcriptional regulator [Pseudonocardia acaciae]
MSSLSWERLRVFAAVAEHGSITAAAEALHITGPAVSQHMRKLEREARCRLVEPDGRGIRLTPAGHLLAGSARDIAATVADAQRDLADASGQVAGPLRIGAMASAIRTLFPDVLRALITAHPRLEPRLLDGEIVDLIPALRARRIDVLVMEVWSAHPATVPAGIRVTQLVTEEVRLAVSARHPLARRASAPLAELTDQVWTACPPHTDQHGALVQILRAHHVDADVRYSVYDFTTQLALVAADLAMALVPRTAVPPGAPVPGVRLLPCEPAVSRSLAVASLATGDTPALRAFVAELTRVTSTDLPPWPEHPALDDG